MLSGAEAFRKPRVISRTSPPAPGEAVSTPAVLSFHSCRAWRFTVRHRPPPLFVAKKLRLKLRPACHVFLKSGRSRKPSAALTRTSTSRASP